jgi:hypothetical protein
MHPYPVKQPHLTRNFPVTDRATRWGAWTARQWVGRIQ